MQTQNYSTADRTNCPEDWPKPFHDLILRKAQQKHNQSNAIRNCSEPISYQKIAQEKETIR
jgi:hypothetical protein